MVACNAIMETLRAQLAHSFAVLDPDAETTGCLVETPFRYPDDRVLTVFVTPLPSGGVELSDDGYAHMYARVSGVSRDVLDRTVTEFEQRYGVQAGHGEVTATTAAESLMNALIAVVETSQGIAETVERRTMREHSNRLDRQIERALVFNGRMYERRARVPFKERDVDVDFNVLPTDQYAQLNLFSLNHKVSLRSAESIAYRLETIQKLTPVPGVTNRVLVISDESSLFGEQGDTWRRARETIRSTGAAMLPVTSIAAISAELAA